LLFSSIIFLWIFLPAVFLGYRLLHERYRNVFLLVASIVFYAWGEPKMVNVMLVSILINYLAGIGIEAANRRWKKILMILCVAVDIGMLGVFKYMTPSLSAMSRWFKWDFAVIDVALPIGISFYTFQAISYIVDVYRGTIKAQKNPIDMGLYISFFPQLIAGPIVKYHDVEQQLKNRTITWEDTAYGIRRFIYGLAKKVLIANQMGVITDDIFAIPGHVLDSPMAWVGVLAFYLQVYFDFSGYSDMAIGLGRMFGFRFMENFNYPFLACSIREFWQRWNISVFTWFREYLYFPLGGSRKGEFRTCVNILLVFAATGIWHGASLSFVAWGLFWGVMLVLERLFLKKFLDNPRLRLLSRVYCLLVIALAGVIFCTDSLPTAAQYMKTMFVWTDNPALRVSDVVTVWGWLLAGTAVLLSGPLQQLVPSLRRALFDEERIYFWEIPVLMLLLGASIVLLAGNAYNPFIYFRF